MVGDPKGEALEGFFPVSLSEEALPGTAWPWHQAPSAWTHTMRSGSAAPGPLLLCTSAPTRRQSLTTSPRHGGP